MSAYAVGVQCAVTVPDDLVELIEAAVEATLRHAQVSPSSTLALLLTDDDHIQELNRNYRRVDEPTDVLSFPAGEAMPGMDQLPHHLGDIAISIPYAARQARAAGHTLANETQLLAVHAVLHLLGHDHAEPDQKRHMWQTQSEILLGLGLSNVDPARESHA